MKVQIRYYERVSGPIVPEIEALRDEFDVAGSPALVGILKEMALPFVAAYAHVYIDDGADPVFAVCDDGSIRDLVAGEWIVEPPANAE